MSLKHLYDTSKFETKPKNNASKTVVAASSSSWNKMFPVEVWDMILRHLDVADLSKFKSVSTTFYFLITKIESEHKWYELCLKEIPSSFWSSLLKHQNDPKICCKNFHKYKKYLKMWMVMYKSWKGWSTLIEKTSTTKTFAIFPDDVAPDWAMRQGLYIRDIDALNNTVVIGDATGRLIFYDISKLSDEPFIHQSQYVISNEVRLCRKDDRIMAVASFKTRNNVSALQYWDVESKELIRKTISRSRQILIDTSYEFCCTIEYPSEDHHYRPCNLTIERLGFGVVKYVSIDRCYGNIQTLFMDGDKVMLITMDEYRRTKIHAITQNHHNVREIQPYNVPRRGLKFVNSSVAVFIDDLFMFSVGVSRAGRDFQYHNVRNDFHLSSSIASILYHVGLLIFGLDSGDVCILYVGEIEQARRFNNDMTKTARRKTIKLDSEPIEFLKVTEFDSKPCIIAATRRKLHVVKFD